MSVVSKNNLTTTMHKVHLCGSLYLCGSFTFMGPFTCIGLPYSLYTYIRPFTFTPMSQGVWGWFAPALDQLFLRYRYNILSVCDRARTDACMHRQKIEGLRRRRAIMTKNRSKTKTNFEKNIQLVCVLYRLQF